MDYVSKYTAKEVDAKLKEVFASTLQTKDVSIEGGSSMEVVPDEGYLALAKVKVGAKTKPAYTGHADVEGLKAIGWTDEDIEYYQQNGVNWNEEDDEYHKVTDDNKALYGVLTADNISTYKHRIVYLPKIDTSGRTSMNNMFQNCYSLVSIPQLNTSNVANMSQMFYDCNSLTSIPQLDTSSVTNMSSMFYRCYSLTSVPQLDTQNVKIMSKMFFKCYSLVSIPQLSTSNVTSMEDMFYNCYSLTSIPQLDTSNVTNMNNMFDSCCLPLAISLLNAQSVPIVSNPFINSYSFTIINIKNIKCNWDLSYIQKLSKESLLYIINNEAATSAITIKLAIHAYKRLANDADVVAALSNHPNISISQ